MSPAFKVYPIGIVHKEAESVEIEIYPQYHDALLGLDAFSHINILYWFHQNDVPEKRRILQVHPRKQVSNPLTGVFATHSPVRPNLIAVSLCRLESVENGILRIDTIDALDGTPVIDIKCYIPPEISRNGVLLPGWVQSGKKSD